VVEWIQQSANPNTRRSYSRYAKEFTTFCEEQGSTAEAASDVTVANFLIYLLEERSLSRGTINDVALAAVADLYKFSENKPHRSPLVRAVKKSVITRTAPPKEKEPISTRTLAKVLIASDTRSFRGCRDFFMILLCYKAFLRESEASALGPGDVWVESIPIKGRDTQVLFVFIEKSKVDQGRIGHTVVVQADRARWKCPMFWFEKYRSLTAGFPTRQGFFFNSKAPYGRLATTHVNSSLKRACQRAGIPAARFSSHCLRVGGVTKAIAAGVEMRLVARHGNWSSSAIFKYIKDDLEAQLRVSAVL
jgi:site-specific recombinase XerD